MISSAPEDTFSEGTLHPNSIFTNYIPVKKNTQYVYGLSTENQLPAHKIRYFNSDGAYLKEVELSNASQNGLKTITFDDDYLIQLTFPDGLTDENKKNFKFKEENNMTVKAGNQITLVDITDAYSVMLTSEAYTFVGGTGGVDANQSCTTEAVAFCGNNQCSVVTVDAKSIVCPTGISAAVSNSGTSKVTIKFTTTATVNAACEATIPVSVDGITINKKFSFAVARTGNTGATGKGIKGTPVTEYVASTGNTTPPTSGWSTSIPSVAQGQYLWTRVTTTYTDNSTSVSYSVAKQGSTGATGTTGSQWYAGTGITGTSTTATAFADSGVANARVNDMYLNTSTGNTYKCKYMWSRTVKVDGAGNKTYTPSQNGVCIAGAKGDTGASGKGIKSTAIAYQLSASQTKAPTGTWLSSPPKTDIATPYLWTRTVITYTDNTTSTSYGVSSTWTPALEDLKTRISDAETAISNNAKEIKLKASRDEVTAISDNLKVLTKTSTEFKQTVEGWQLNWDKLISTDNAEVASHQDYITFDKGDIILGESSNDLKLKITNDSIQFKGTSNTEVTPDSDATAWITGKTFHISDGEIQNSLKFGKLYLKPNNENNSVDLYYSDSESDVISGSYVRLGQTISMGNGMGSGFLKLNTGCIQMYPTTLADTNGNGNTGKFELHAGGSYPYIIFGDYNTNDEAKKEKGRYSVRIGGSNTVSGNCSVAIGYSSDVSGKNSTAIGHYLKNISDNQLLIGKYNISSDYPFIIGNGSSDTERSNALTVDWDGNITGKSLTSANDLKLGFGSSNIFKPYFTKGDSITLTIYAVGYVTTGGKEVAMYVPLSRPIIAGGSVSVASVHGLTIRQNGKYLYSSSASNSVNPSSFRAAIVGSGCGVNIVATFGNTVNATVNDVCSITASIKITFS